MTASKSSSRVLPFVWGTMRSSIPRSCSSCRYSTKLAVKWRSSTTTFSPALRFKPRVTIFSASPVAKRSATSSDFAPNRLANAMRVISFFSKRRRVSAQCNFSSTYSTPTSLTTCGMGPIHDVARNRKLLVMGKSVRTPSGSSSD